MLKRLSVDSVNEEGMVKKRGKKEKRSSMARAIEAIIGGLVAYVSSYATGTWRLIFFILGIIIILHALLQD